MDEQIPASKHFEPPHAEVLAMMTAALIGPKSGIDQATISRAMGQAMMVWQVVSRALATVKEPV